MENLEKFIRENRDEFDTTEPLDGHFERFRERLGSAEENQATGISRFYFLKVAAIILLFITISVFVFDQAARSVRNRFSKETPAAQLPVEITEAMQYYDAKAISQLSQVRKLASDPVQADLINEDALKEMEALDAGTKDLQQSLAENPNNDRIQAAIIQNQQMKEGIMNTIISKLSKH
jgi:hypothetical protein